VQVTAAFSRAGDEKMRPSRCMLLTHAIMGSGDKLHDEGLCGALWAGGGGGQALSAGNRHECTTRSMGFGNTDNAWPRDSI
jgi:hypothetical protein